MECTVHVGGPAPRGAQFGRLHVVCGGYALPLPYPPPPGRKQRPCPSNTRHWLSPFLHRGFWRHGL